MGGTEWIRNSKKPTYKQYGKNLQEKNVFFWELTTGFFLFLVHYSMFWPQKGPNNFGIEHNQNEHHQPNFVLLRFPALKNLEVPGIFVLGI